jgi:hypothetical protein
MTTVDLYRITRHIYIQFHATDDGNACDDYITITRCVFDGRIPSRSFIFIQDIIMSMCLHLQLQYLCDSLQMIVLIVMITIYCEQIFLSFFYR